MYSLVSWFAHYLPIHCSKHIRQTIFHITMTGALLKLESSLAFTNDFNNNIWYRHTYRLDLQNVSVKASTISSPMRSNEQREMMLFRSNFPVYDDFNLSELFYR